MELQPDLVAVAGDIVTGRPSDLDGGKPIGLMGYAQLPQEVRFYHRPFAEYAEEDWVERFLKRLMSTMKQHFESQGFSAVDMGEPENN